MTRRLAKLGGLAGLCAVALSGCLLRDSEPKQIWIQPHNQADIQPATPPVTEATPPQDPMPVVPSDYHQQPPSPAPTQTSMSLDPAVTPVSLEIKPITELPPPPRRDPPLVAALRCALEQNPDEARQLLEKYNKNDRELLLNLLQVTARLSDKAPRELPPEEIAATLHQLSHLTTRFQQLAPLTLDHVAFCKTIEGFGRYQPLPPRYEFQAGYDGRPGERVQVYAEVRHFASKHVGGVYETVLESKLEIRDAQGQKVVMQNLGRCTDRSHSPRRDHFLNFQLHVPPKLPPGRLYTLWLTVKDVTEVERPGAREAVCSLDFLVCAPGSPPSMTEVNKEVTSPPRR